MNDRPYHTQPLRRRLPAPTARGLGLFSIALGTAELLMPRTMARLVGMHGSESLLRLYGVREIATGIGILTARQPAPWIWGRVAGDALDLATLASHAGRHKPASLNTCAALAAVGTVAAVDVACAKSLNHEAPPRAGDYSDRSGLPMPASEMRGAARADFEVPRDMRTPQALRPYIH